MQLYDQIQEALSYLRTKTDFEPDFGIILGTGLSDLAQEGETKKENDKYQTWAISLNVSGRQGDELFAQGQMNQVQGVRNHTQPAQATYLQIWPKSNQQPGYKPGHQILYAELVVDHPKYDDRKKVKLPGFQLAIKTPKQRKTQNEEHTVIEKKGRLIGKYGNCEEYPCREPEIQTALVEEQGIQEGNQNVILKLHPQSPVHPIEPLVWGKKGNQIPKM